MMNSNELQRFHNLPYSGHEGFLSDLIEELNPEDLHHDDLAYLIDMAEVEGLALHECWTQLTESECE